MLETRFALAYRGVVDASSIGRMDMRTVNALGKRLDKQIEAEAKQREKERSEAAKAARSAARANRRKLKL